MASSLSNLVDNLAKGIHKIKCKDFDCFLAFESIKNNFINYKCLSCKKDYSDKLNEKLKKRFKNALTFSDNDINKFILLLRKGVYCYEYIHDWDNFNETTLPEKEEFYSNFNMEDMTDADFMQANRVCKDFEKKKIVEYHDLYLKGTLSGLKQFSAIKSSLKMIKKCFLSHLKSSFCSQDISIFVLIF